MGDLRVFSVLCIFRDCLNSGILEVFRGGDADGRALRIENLIWQISIELEARAKGLDRRRRVGSNDRSASVV